MSRYTAVPWDLIDAKDQEAAQKAAVHLDEQRPPAEGWKLGDKNAAIRASFSRHSPTGLSADATVTLSIQ